MREAERQIAAARLQADAPRLVATWLPAWPDGELARDRAESVVRAVIGALVSPIEPHLLVDAVVIPGVTLDQCVHRLGLLRDVLYQEVQAVVSPADVGEVTHVLASAIDAVLEATVARVATDLAEAALVDPLTGRPNRRALELDLARAVANADRFHQDLAVVMVDLDGLKQRNDLDGHAAGDAALCALAEALQAGLRAGDGAYRLGGDEFVLVLPAASLSDADVVMARVQGSGPPAFSWGAACFPEEGRDGAGLIALADQRLYAGRRQRRQASRNAGVILPALSHRRLGWRGVRTAAVGVRIASVLVPVVVAGTTLAIVQWTTGDSRHGATSARPHAVAAAPGPPAGNRRAVPGTRSVPTTVPGGPPPLVASHAAPPMSLATLTVAAARSRAAAPPAPTTTAPAVPSQNHRPSAPPPTTAPPPVSVTPSPSPPPKRPADHDDGDTEEDHRDDGGGHGGHGPDGQAWLATGLHAHDGKANGDW